MTGTVFRLSPTVKIEVRIGVRVQDSFTYSTLPAGRTTLFALGTPV